MARTYVKLYTKMWAAEEDFAEMPTDAQWLYWVMLSHPSLSPAGCLPFKPRLWARRSPDMTLRRVTVALQRLVKDAKVLIDEDTGELLIRTFIRYDQGHRTPNIRKSIEAAIAQIDSDVLRDAATDELGRAVTLSATHPPTLTPTLPATLS